jgi:hypothetical protein
MAFALALALVKVEERFYQHLIENYDSEGTGTYELTCVAFFA